MRSTGKNLARRWARDRRVVAVVVALLFLVSGALTHAQDQQPTEQTDQQGQQQTQQQPQQGQASQEQPGPLSAEEIIQILQDNPDLLAEAKSRIAGELQDRGYAVTESDITDERLFTEIRSDDRVRLTMSDALERRGYLPEGEEGEGEGTAAQPSATQGAGAQGTTTAGQGAGAPSQPGGKGISTTRPPRRRVPKRVPTNAAPQSNYPYRNLPALQDLYTQATVSTANLERFGSALFKNASAAGIDKASLDVPVGPDYVLGPGDEVIVNFWGSASQRLQLTVDRQGQIALPDVGTILIAGRTLGDAKDLIQKALVRQYREVNVDVSLGKLRTVRIYVVGEVNKPGAYDISSLSTPINALLAAGGPTDRGSLRTVKHFRGKTLVDEVDLYDLLLNGVSVQGERLQPGDSLLVPLAGPQVTMAGMVRRPAIYELRGEKTLSQALNLAGGVPVSGELTQIRVERIVAHQRKQMLSINLPPNGDVQAIQDAYKKFGIEDGDRITVLPIAPYSEKTVYLEGHVLRPGKSPYREGITVLDLVKSFQDLLPEPADRAEIIRLHPPDNRPYVIGFNLREVLDKELPPPALQPFDTVRVYGRYEADAPKVAIYGEVLRPGEYPLSDRMTAADLVSLAGGFKRSAYTSSADLASYEVVNGDHVEIEHREIPISEALEGDPDTDVVLKAGDVLTISRLGGWSNIGGAITISGEVDHPGRYGIQEGERLSSVLKRAGGFRADAYPYGAVLERVQVREMAAKNRDEMIRKLQSQALEGGTKTESLATSRQRQQLISKLQQIQPSGRVVINITPDIGKWQSTPADVVVRPGDTLIIPRRPTFVLVSGQVYNPTAITYSLGKNADWYLKRAGGPTKLGDKKEIFVVRANGSVVGRTSGDFWSGGVLNTTLQPGDTVYVPEKISGPSKLATYGQVANVMSGVAVALHLAGAF